MTPRLGTIHAGQEGAAGPDGGGFTSAFQTVTIGGVEAKGVGLRSLGSGNITLTDVPQDPDVLVAYLYWEILANAEGPSFPDVTFDGQAVQGELLAQGLGLCWGTASTFAYRADVTDLIDGARMYELADVDSGRTDGGDISFPQPLAEGASLVVVWQDLQGGNIVEVSIIDGFAALIGTQDTFTFPPSILPPIPVLGTTTLHYMGGDGQSNAATEVTRVNGAVVAVDSWDGSDPQRVPDHPIGNLWDTDAVDVTAQVKAGTPTAVNVQSISDCIGPIAFVQSQRIL